MILPAALGILQQDKLFLPFFFPEPCVGFYMKITVQNAIWQLQDTLTVVFFSLSYFHPCHENRKAILPLRISSHSRGCCLF